MPQASDFARVTVEDPAFPVPFACSWEPRGSGSACVHVCGEAQLRADTIFIDLQDLAFVGCSGLTALYETNESFGRAERAWL